MPFAGAGPSVGVEPAAKRRRKGQLMPKVKELDETHGISLTELISVFHVLHRDVDGRVPLREIASLVAGRRLASGLHARANLQAALGEKWGGGKAAAEAACCDCGGCLPVSAASSERSLSPEADCPAVPLLARRSRKRANTDDGGGRGGDRAEALGESEEFTHSDRDRSELSGGDASRRSGSVRRARRDVEHRLVERKVRSENAGHVRGARGGGASSSESGGRSDSGEDSEGVSANSGSFRSLYPSSEHHLEFDDFDEGVLEAARRLSAGRAMPVPHDAAKRAPSEAAGTRPASAAPASPTSSASSDDIADGEVMRAADQVLWARLRRDEYRRSSPRAEADGRDAADDAPLRYSMCSLAVADLATISVSSAYLALSGYDRAEVLGRSSRYLQGPGTDTKMIAALMAAVAAGEAFEVCGLVNYRKDGSAFEHDLLVTPLRRARDGTPLFYVGISNCPAKIRDERIALDPQR